MEELNVAIREEIVPIHSYLLDRVKQNWKIRLDECIQMKGRHLDDSARLLSLSRLTPF